MPKIQLVFVLIVQQDRATRKDKEKITVFYFLLKIPLFFAWHSVTPGIKN